MNLTAMTDGFACSVLCIALHTLSSVVLRYCVKTAKHVVEIHSLSASQSLYFQTSRGPLQGV